MLILLKLLSLLQYALLHEEETDFISTKEPALIGSLHGSLLLQEVHFLIYRDTRDKLSGKEVFKF
jgi:hypothetical protein